MIVFVQMYSNFMFQRKWDLRTDGFLHFPKEENDTDGVIPAKDLAEQTIMYARELEMIV